MDRKEKYTHTRNYGCRIRRYVQNGIRMVALENQLIKVVFAQDKGTDITELVYKSMDVDCMWHSFNELQNINHIATKAPSNGNFLDSYAGGWQELFPTYGGAAMYQGGEIGVHGEACIYPWECEILEDTIECVKVKFSLRTVRTPFLLEKTVWLCENSAKLSMHQKVTNLGDVPLDFMWGHHPAFGWPFVDERTRLYLKGAPTVTVPQWVTKQNNCPFAEETTGVWPVLKDKNGNNMDMSRAYAHEDKIYMEYGLSGLQEGRYELVNEEMGLGVRMSWDVNLFRYLWIWGMYCGHESYPWYGRAYTMAVEPWSCMPGDLEAAREAGEALHLEAGKSMETDISAELFVTGGEDRK